MRPEDPFARDPSPRHDPSVCWLCGGEKRVEWSGAYLDDSENLIHEDGVYDPCPECDETSRLLSLTKE